MSSSPSHESVGLKSVSVAATGPIETVAFFGTPAFSVPTLNALLHAGRRPAVVVSQPARQVGRGRKVRQPPVAQWALDQDVQLLQPERVKRRAFRETLGTLKPDIAIVVAFGQIFPQSLLDLPRFGCINLHASLLPRHRGASPISAAIAALDQETGACTMRMEAGLDTGPVYQRCSVGIESSDTTETLGTRLAELGGDLVVETLSALEAGTATLTPQDDGMATYAHQIEKSEGDVDWQLSAPQIEARLRAFTPWPGLSTWFREKPLKLVGIALPEASEDVPASVGSTAVFGEIEAVLKSSGERPDSLQVACGGGSSLWLQSVQRPGKRAVSMRDFFNGEQPRVGELLGVRPDVS